MPKSSTWLKNAVSTTWASSIFASRDDSAPAPVNGGKRVCRMQCRRLDWAVLPLIVRCEQAVCARGPPSPSTAMPFLNCRLRPQKQFRQGLRSAPKLRIPLTCRSSLGSRSWAKAPLHGLSEQTAEFLANPMSICRMPSTPRAARSLCCLPTAAVVTRWFASAGILTIRLAFAQEALRNSIAGDAAAEAMSHQQASGAYTVKSGDFRLLVSSSLGVDWNDNINAA